VCVLVTRVIGAYVSVVALGIVQTAARYFALGQRVVFVDASLYLIARVLGARVVVVTIDRRARQAQPFAALVVWCAGILIVARSCVGSVDASQIGVARVIGAGVVVVAHLSLCLTDPVEAGSLVAAESFQVARRAVGFLLVDAPHFLVTGIQRALVVIVTVDRNSGAFEDRPLVDRFAVIIIGAVAPVVAGRTLREVVLDARVRTLLCLVVAPGGHTGVLGHALVLGARQAVALSIATVRVGTRISIFAGVPFGLVLGQVALPRSLVAHGEYAIVGIEVVAVFGIAGYALAGLADIVQGTERAVALNILVDRLVHAALLNITGILSAPLPVVAIKVHRAHAYPVVVAGIQVRARV